MKKFMIALAASAAVIAAVPAAAAPIVIDFEGVASQTSVGNYYNGGTGGNLGVSFNGFTAYTGSGLPASTIAYNASPTAYGNVSNGFTSLSFLYGFLAAGTVSVFSGLNGTGTLLGSSAYASNISSTTGQAYSSGNVSFTGLGQSFALTGSGSQLALDNITLNATGAVPEPATWAMLILGMAAVGYSMRRSNVKFDAKIKRMTANAA